MPKSIQSALQQNPAQTLTLSSLRRFFYQHPQSTAPLYQLAVGSVLLLSDSVFHHWCRVLRAPVDEQGVLFDGYGYETVVKLTDISKKNARVVIIAHHDITRQSDMNVTVAMVMSRGDRSDYAIQKATELGVTHIQLLSSQHGEVNLKASQVEKKLTHWQQVALSACEQCGLNYPPIIHAPLKMTDWLESKKDVNSYTHKESYILESMTKLATQKYYQPPTLSTNCNTETIKLILTVPHHNESEPVDVHRYVIQQMQQFNKNPASSGRLTIEVLIGPEGGFSNTEHEQAIAAGFIAFQLGNRVLRAETAPVVALSTLNTLSHLAATIHF